MIPILLLMILAACDRIVDNNIYQNVTSLSSVVTPIETIPDSENATDNSSDEPEQVENNMIDISIIVGDSVFSAKFYDNEAARALLEQFPITLDMSELNANEKYYYLPDKLQTNSQQVGSINTGDLMLYGSDCLVIFYKSFSTSYSYTKLGYIEDVSDLATTLGSGNVVVTFAVTQ